MKIEPLLAIDSNSLIAKENKVINVSKGPQFKTKGGTILAMIFLLFLFLSVAFLYQAEFLLASICFFISVVIFSLVLDIHGIEFDTSEHKIRDYKAFLWFRIGKWSNINDFKSIYLTQKNVTIRTSGYSGGSADTYHYYHIKLIDEMNKKEILLAEYKNYYKALKICRSVAEATGLEFKDFLKKHSK